MKISEYQSKLKNKTFSCTEFVTESVKKSQALNTILNHYILIDEKGAIESARLVDTEISRSKDLEKLFVDKPLLGVTISLKDLFTTKDLETTAGSNILKGYIPPYDATVVVKLKSAGAIVLGKLNEDAFGHGATGQNSDFGPAKNPYDLDRVAGGSSSGSGVAVSTDSVFAATGTDTGGSIRNPASYTNTVGIKPTYGLVSRYGIIAMASSLDSIGHISQTVEDSARILEITSGYDKEDATSNQTAKWEYLKNVNSSISGMTIGVPDEYMSEGVDPEVLNAVENVLEIYKKLGCNIKRIKLPLTPYAISVYYLVMPCEVSSNLARFDGIRFGHEREIFGDEAKRRIMLGTYALSAGYYDEYYLKSEKVRTLIKNEFENAFKDVDVILGPVSPVLPTKLGEDVDDPLKMYLLDVLTVASNLAGVPSLAVPAGFSKSGLPIGIQIMGKHFDEQKLYQLGQALENETEFYKVKPKLVEGN